MIGSLGTKNFKVEIIPFRVRCLLVRSLFLSASFSLDSYSLRVLFAILKQYSIISQWGHVGLYNKQKLPYIFSNLKESFNKLSSIDLEHAFNHRTLIKENCINKVNFKK